MFATASNYFSAERDSSTPQFRRWNVKCVFLWNVTNVQKFAVPSWSV